MENNLFLFWKNAVGNKFCNDVIKFASTLEKQEASTTGPKHKQVFSDYRKSKIVWLSDKWIYKELLKFVDMANKSTYNFDLTRAEAIQYTRYDSNGHYEWHVDQLDGPVEDAKPDTRKLSLCLNLTDPDEYEGGDFWICKPHPLPENAKKIKLDFMQTRGAAVVFPSYVFHKVAPVTKGTRHSLVCWMRGKRWR
tara:strand:- start:384 stop:965 length:582 start_codon:yes stop_codon:yes gene_type:complete